MVASTAMLAKMTTAAVALAIRLANHGGCRGPSKCVVVLFGGALVAEDLGRSSPQLREPSRAADRATSD
eukprot:CAMPEP_0170304958 /NCGR_PEP_ID=MMETSP0116_2-20130129/52835_1 /TAXON_ID=400756 /ORGANISM="Durinskia baltica, Strain CSIRO CS-38" /LENGTH=68 /DNA_ID=CAMNT_0010556973 /DNA_START=74 /DNA_END=278 /DNA_ORIENTATION=+